MQASASLLGRQTIASDSPSPDRDGVPDLSRFEFDRHLARRGIGPTGYRAYLALTCALAKEHGYAYPTQQWLADALHVTVSTIGNYARLAVERGHQRIVRTGRSSEYYPQLAALGLTDGADQIRKNCRSLSTRDSKMGAVATATATAPTAPSPESAPLSAAEKSALRALPDGEAALGLLHRRWMQGSQALAHKAARQVLHHDAQKHPVRTAAGLLIKCFKDLLDRHTTCVAEEAARERIGEYKPRPRTPPSAVAEAARVALKHNLGAAEQKVQDGADVLALLKERLKKKKPPEPEGDPPDAETS